MGTVTFGAHESDEGFMPFIQITAKVIGPIEFIAPAISFKTEAEAKAFVEAAYLILSGPQTNLQKHNAKPDA